MIQSAEVRQVAYTGCQLLSSTTKGSRTERHLELNMFMRSPTPIIKSAAVMSTLGHQNKALLAAGSTLLVAYSNLSLTGFLFLCMFLFWGAACISTPQAAASYRQHKRLWTTAAAAALTAFTLQLTVQLLYGFGMLPSSSSSGDEPQQQHEQVLIDIFEALGLSSMNGLGVGHVLLMLVAPLICVLTAAAETSEASQVITALRSVPPQLCVTNQQEQQQQSSAQPAAATEAVVSAFAPMTSIPLTLGLQFTNSGVMTVITMLLCAVLWPSCLNLVYLLVICWGLVCWGWDSSKTWIKPVWVVALQAFVGVHLLLLYLAQVPLLQLPKLDVICDILGLYNMHNTAALTQLADLHSGSGILALQITHMICLHLLYTALGLYIGLVRQPLFQRVADAIKDHHHQQQQQQKAARRQHQQRQQQQHSRGGRRYVKIQEGLLEPLLVTESGSPSPHSELPTSAFLDHTGQRCELHTQQPMHDHSAGPARTSSNASSSSSGLDTSSPAEVSSRRSSGSGSGYSIDGMVDAAVAKEPTAAAVAKIADQPVPATWQRLQQQQQTPQQQEQQPELLHSTSTPHRHQGAGSSIAASPPAAVMHVATHNAPPATTTAAAAVGAAGSSALGRWEQCSVLLQVLLPFLVGCGEFMLRQLLAAPAVAGIAIAAYSLVQVSVIGCATLLLALWSLLAPSRFAGNMLPAASPLLLLFYITWLINAYLATALDGIVTAPAVLKSVGVWGYSQQFPALLPLLLHLLTTVAVAGLSCSRKAAAGSSGSNAGGVFLPAAVAAAAGIADWGSTAGWGFDESEGTAGSSPTAAAAAGEYNADSNAYAGRSLSHNSDIIAAGSSVAAAGRELRHLWSLGHRISGSPHAMLGFSHHHSSAPTSPTLAVNPTMAVNPSSSSSSSAPTTPLNPDHDAKPTRQFTVRTPSPGLRNLLGSSPTEYGQSFGRPTAAAAVQQVSVSGALLQQDASFVAAAAARSPRAAASTIAAAARPSKSDDPAMRPWSELLNRLWSGFGTGLIQVAWHLGRVLVPLSCVVLAASQPDVLHGVYLLAMLVGFWDSSGSSWGLAPQAPRVPEWFLASVTGSSSSRMFWLRQQQQQQPHALPAMQLPHHRLLRFYGSCHLLVVYLALVMQLPGLQSDLNEYILKLVGLWDPKILSDLIPVTLLLVAATVHVTLGKWLLTRPPAGNWCSRASRNQGIATPPAAGRSPGLGLGPLHEDAEHQEEPAAATSNQISLLWYEAIHPRFLFKGISWCGRMAVSVGAAAVVLLGYLLLLLDTPVGLLGCGYLLLLVLLLLLQPQPEAAAATAAAAEVAVAPGRQQQPRWQQQQQRSNTSFTRDSALLQPLVPSSAAAVNSSPAAAAAAAKCSSTSSRWRWLLPLLLAAVCIVDLTAQYVLVVGAVVQDQPLLPADVAAWIRDVIGIDDSASGRLLLAALLRPTLLLAALAVYRGCFGIGSMVQQQAGQQQQQRVEAGPAAAAVAAQHSWQWLIKRCLIIHSDLLVGVCCFAAAMQAPSALGLLMLCCIVIIGVQQNALLPRYSSSSSSRRRSASYRRRFSKPRDLFMDSCVIAVQLLAAAWLLMQYTMQVDWLRSLLLSHSPPLLPWLLLWLGLPVSGDDDTQAQVQGLGLEVMLRAKTLVLVAAAVRQKAQQWQQLLPEAVVAAAAPNYPCPLFWPPTAATGGAQQQQQDVSDVFRTPGQAVSDSQAAAAAAGSSLSGSWDELEPVLRRAEQLVSPLAALVIKLLHQLGLLTARVLAAMDLPDSTMLIYTQNPKPSAAAAAGSTQQGSWPQTRIRVLGSKVLWFMAVSSSGVRLLVEEFWTTWGAEAVMLLLLAAAFISSNAWSLVYLLLVGLGMVAAAGGSTAAAGRRSGGSSSSSGWWWRLVLAVLVLSLIIQYTALLGPYPTSPPGMPSQPAAAAAAAAATPLHVTQHTLAAAAAAAWGHPDNNSSSSSSRDSYLLGPGLSADVYDMYQSLLHPAWATAAAAMHHNASADIQYIHPGSSTSTSSSGSSSSSVTFTSDPVASPPAQLLVWYWLGLAVVQPVVLWLLAAALVIVMNVITVMNSERLAAAAAATAFEGVQVEQEAVSQAAWLADHQQQLDGSSSSSGAWHPTLHASPQHSLLTAALQRGSSSTPAPAPAPAAVAAALAQQQQQQQQLFKPISYSLRSQWTLLDWIRFQLLKHFLDIVLVCVAALCTVQKDLLHAGYLAIALVFFRHRHQLMQPPAAAAASGSSAEGNLFLWLPVFNFFVMAATLIHQAPLELLLGPSWANSCHTLGPSIPVRCNLPHLLGFCKLLTWQHTLNPTPAAAATVLNPLLYSYSYAFGAFAGYSNVTSFFRSGAFADLLLWVLLRLQCKLFMSDVYAKVMSCVKEEARVTAARLQQRQQQWYNQQARTALATSRLRTARTLRISKLKASMLEEEYGGKLVYRSSGDMAAAAAAADLNSAPNARPGLDQIWDDGEQWGNDAAANSQQQLEPDSTAAGSTAAKAAAAAAASPPPSPLANWRSKFSSLLPGLSSQQTPHDSSSSSSGSRTPPLPLSKSYDPTSGLAALVSDSSSAVSDGSTLPPLPAGSSIRQQQQQQQQPSRPTATPAVHYRHARSASDSHIWHSHNAPSQQQQRQQYMRRAASSAAAPAAVLCQVQEYILPDPRLQLLLPSCDTGSSRAHSRSQSTDHTAAAAQPWTRSNADLTAAAGGGSSSPPGPAGFNAFWSWLCRKTSALLRGSSGWEQGLCCGLFILGFVLDFSVLSLVYVVSMLLVPLLSSGRSRGYWMNMLVYTEVLLVLQYSFLTAARCLCTSDNASSNNAPDDSSSSSSSNAPNPLDPTDSDSSSSSSSGCSWSLPGFSPQSSHELFVVLGLNARSSHVTPLFLIYLATLMYNYLLRSYPHVTADLVGNRFARVSSMGVLTRFNSPSRPRLFTSRTAASSSNSSSGALLLLIALQGWWRQLLLWLRVQCHHLAYHIRYVIFDHERGPSWLKLDLAPPQQGQPCWTSPEGAAMLEICVQTALDDLRSSDIEHAAAAAAAMGTSAAATDGTWDTVAAPNQQSAEGNAFEDSIASLRRHSSSSSSSSDGKEHSEIQAADPGSDAFNTTLTPPPAAVTAAAPGFWDLLGLGSFVLNPSNPTTTTAAAAAAAGRVGKRAGDVGGLSRRTRLVLRLDRVLADDDSSRLKPRGSAVALFEVIATPFKLEADWPLSWWPQRSSRPGRDAATALLRLMAQQQQQQQQQAMRQAAPSSAAATAGSEQSTADLQQNIDRLCSSVEACAGAAEQIKAAAAAPSSTGSSTAAALQPAPAHVVFDALMGMPESDVQLASRLASVVTAGVPTSTAAAAEPQNAQSTTTVADDDDTAEAVPSLPHQQQQQRSCPVSPLATTASLLDDNAQLSQIVTGVEHHAQPQQDFYSLNALLDFLAFLYLAIFYQVVMSNTRTLADLTDERQLPWDYLSALLLLFVITVTDRLVYSLGSHLGKSLLLLGQLLLFIPACMSLFWFTAASSSSSNARLHLRAFMLLKCVSWVITALQLKSGFPPRASFDGGGRQRFVFYKQADMRHMMGFYIFQAVPFLYELRALLDWTCSATPLNWYQWLKLEDIRASLFIEQCRSAMREKRLIGERVPRYIKFLQGTLLFCVLLLAIWAPLLLFSSGAPTYTTPGIQGAQVNASIGVVTKYGHYQGVMSFPVFEAGSRRTVQNWASDGSSSGGSGGGVKTAYSGASRVSSSSSAVGIGNSSSSNSSSGGTLPADLSGYSPEQIKLVCLSHDSDQLWQLSPPARSALEVVLQEPSASLQLSWGITRTAPLASGKGGPGCQGQVTVQLAGETRMQLLEVVRGVRSTAQLMALNTSDPDGWAPGHTGPVGLYWLFWRLNGESCAVKTYMGGDVTGSTSTRNKRNAAYRELGSSDAQFVSVRDGRVWYGATLHQQQDGRAGGNALHTPPSYQNIHQTSSSSSSPIPSSGVHARPETLSIMPLLSAAFYKDATGDGGDHDGTGLLFDWANLQVGCNVSIAGNDTSGGRWWQITCDVIDQASSGSPQPPPASGSDWPWFRSQRQQRRQPSRSLDQPDHVDLDLRSAPDHDVRSDPDPDDPDPDPDGSSSSSVTPGYATCGPAVQGPLLVVVLERVQSGLLGAALSAFGITGLYFSVVFGIGRFLRLTVSNIRLRIPYEDFPSTRRLLAMVQDIYIARAEGELQLEEELFYLLLKIYKTPQLLNELTRLPPAAAPAVTAHQ